jgi:leucyl-tRNA synthetase
MNKDYQPSNIEKIAQAVWETNTSSKVDFSTSDNKYYVLSMFPYPSGKAPHRPCQKLYNW